MADKWKSYFCNVNDHPASIFVNLGLRDDVPILSKTSLLWVWVYFRSPRPDGLSDGKEAPTLFKIEDALDLSVAQVCRAIPCGRITTEGHREFYFYGETSDGFAETVKSALAGFEGYKFEMGEQQDPLWEQYLDVLYPSPEDLERIKNRDVLDVLTEKGDVLSAAREVRHWLYFRSQQARNSFSEDAAKVGFRVVSESAVDGELHFGVSVARTQSVEQEHIDATVIELVRLAQRFEGEYDGWETPIVTQ